MSSAFPIVIHHNPDCGTSRNVLQIIEAAGYTPVIIDYLRDGWTRGQLLALFAAANLTPREALRTTKSPAEELGLLDEQVGDAAILDRDACPSGAGQPTAGRNADGRASMPTE